MKRPLLIILIIVLAAALVWALTNRDSSAGTPNPASVYCQQQGGRVEIRTGADGQFGVCVFPDGSECEEWAFYNNNGSCDAP